jgi:hypothetical protein
MNPEYFECKCNHAEHVLRFTYDEDGNDIYTEVQLSPRSFLGRLLVAIRYLFGRKCKFGAWDCTLLRNEDIPRLIKLLERTKENEVSDRTD